MNLELLYYYLEKAKWCLKHSKEPIHSTNAYLKCIENILNNISEHQIKCECGGEIYYVVATGSSYLQCSCCDWMTKA